MLSFINCDTGSCLFPLFRAWGRENRWKQKQNSRASLSSSKKQIFTLFLDSFFSLSEFTVNLAMIGSLITKKGLIETPCFISWDSQNTENLNPDCLSSTPHNFDDYFDGWWLVVLLVFMSYPLLSVSMAILFYIYIRYIGCGFVLFYGIPSIVGNLMPNALCIYMMPSICFHTFFVQAFKMSEILDNSLCYYYTAYKMTDQYLWFQVQMNSYSSN